MAANCATFINGLAAHASSDLRDDDDIDNGDNDNDNNNNDDDDDVTNDIDYDASTTTMALSEAVNDASAMHMFGDVVSSAVTSARIAVRGAALVRFMIIIYVFLQQVIIIFSNFRLRMVDEQTQQ